MRGEKIHRIDGSAGEGGGQILRTALALSAFGREPFVMKNIRASRPRPGLRNQHIQCVRAAGAVCGAEIRGAHKGSQELDFVPGRLRRGDFDIDIGSAGSTALVLQTIFLPLSFAGGTSRVTIRGGTHNGFCPIFDYLELLWAPFIRDIGFDVSVSLGEAGYYPKGGGRLSAKIAPAAGTAGLSLDERGALGRVLVRAAVTRLPLEVAERSAARMERGLVEAGIADFETEIIERAGPFPGAYALIFAEYEGGACCFFGLGRPGVRAEEIAGKALDDFLAFHDSPATVDGRLADQALLPLAVCGKEASFVTNRITRHITTNAGIIREFLGVDISIEPMAGGCGRVKIRPGRIGASVE